MRITSRHLRGFTLIEIILGIVILGIAITGILSVLLAQAEKSVVPVFEAKAAVIADQIISRLSRVAYDENADQNGGICRCGESLVGDIDGGTVSCMVPACTLPANFGPENKETSATSALDFNDFDDFDTTKICKKKSQNNFGCNTHAQYCATEECIIVASFFGSKYFNSDVFAFDQWIKDTKEIDSAYKGFYVKIDVTPQNIAVGGTTIQMKLAKITVISPRGDTYQYSLIKGNY